MYNRAIFFCEHNNGDVFESREFVKALMNIIRAKKYDYSHKKSPRILQDIPNLSSVEFNPIFKSNLLYVTLPNNDLAINMWIGNGKYGCLVENHFDMHNGTLQKLGLESLPGSPRDYLPKIDYSKFYIEKVDEFFSKRTSTSVFIDNGLVQSLQANNFYFDPIIIKLAGEFKNILFITSIKISQQNLSNIIWSGDIIQTPKSLDNDLMENSYVSRFCKVIIGRNSGSFVFSGTDENLNSREKTFMSFCYEKKVATFHVNQSVASTQIWSGVTDAFEVYSYIKSQIWHL